MICPTVYGKKICGAAYIAGSYLGECHEMVSTEASPDSGHLWSNVTFELILYCFYICWNPNCFEFLKLMQSLLQTFVSRMDDSRFIAYSKDMCQIHLSWFNITLNWAWKNSPKHVFSCSLRLFFPSSNANGSHHRIDCLVQIQCHSLDQDLRA